MKKPIFFIIAFFIVTVAIAQTDIINYHELNLKMPQDKNIRFDSLITVRTDGVMKEFFNSDGKILSYVFISSLGGEMDNDSRHLYTYNNYGNLISLQIQGWSTVLNDWVDSQRYVYTYDIDQNMLSETHQSYSYDDWENKFRTNYTYDSENFISTETEQTWEENIWLNQYMSEYSTNEFGDILKQTRYSWHDEQWNKSVLYSYTYDENSNNIVYLWQIWVENDWKNYKLTTLTYDEINNELTRTVQNWDNNAWINDYRISRSYTNGTKYKTWTSEIFNNDWDTTSYTIFSYNYSGLPDSIYSNNLTYGGEKLIVFNYGENDLLSSKIEYKRYSGDIWLNNELYDYENSDGHIHANFFEYEDDSWVDYPNDWGIPIYFNGEEILERYGITVDLYYSMVSGDDEIEDKYSDNNFRLYPNPAGNYITIKLENKNYKEVQYELLDLNGKLIVEGEMTSTIKTIDLSNVLSGQYILRLYNESSNLISSQKFVKR